MVYNIDIMKLYENKDWLTKQYWGTKLSSVKIAKICSVTKTTIFRWMRRHDIPRRNKIDVDNLREGTRKYLLNENIFKECDTAEKAYWIGFIMADGNISHRDDEKHYRLKIRLQKRDKNHIEKFLKFLSSNVPIKETNYNNNPPTAGVEINGKKLVNTLEQYGIVPRKTGKEQIKNIPEQYYPDFIRGYFDGDGCLALSKRYRKRNSLAFFLACASQKFLQEVQDILLKECNLTKTKIIQQNNCYSLRYGGNLQVPRIFNYLLQNSDVQLERKYKLLEEN
ncbi:hypothetical protein LCGC14_0912750 [marine sediment metagenome]|uniref:DOD-type homing endonuclease domain-containing protein n=1 Tax=marine sediment metagenome TaxID=412755 RepID=A0A0F9NT11_9ZZZZ